MERSYVCMYVCTFVVICMRVCQYAHVYCCFFLSPLNCKLHVHKTFCPKKKKKMNKYTGL